VDAVFERVKCQKTLTTTITPSMVPLKRDLGRTKCKRANLYEHRSSRRDRF